VKPKILETLIIPIMAVLTVSFVAWATGAHFSEGAVDRFWYVKIGGGMIFGLVMMRREWRRACDEHSAELRTKGDLIANEVMAAIGTCTDWTDATVVNVEYVLFTDESIAPFYRANIYLNNVYPDDDGEIAAAETRIHQHVNRDFMISERVVIHVEW